MSDLVFVKNKTFNLGTQKFIKFQVLKKSKKTKKFIKMKEKDYREMLEVIDEKRDQLPTKSNNTFDFMIRAESDEGWKTIKGYGQHSSFDSYLEYYQDKTKAGADFYKKFDQFQLVIKYDK